MAKSAENRNHVDRDRQRKALADAKRVATARHTHVCAVPDCEERVPTSRLMCSPHWEEVPPDLRRKVSAAWRIWKWNFADLDSALRHREAADAAVKAVTG